jgi:hypothetical protein
MLDKINNNDPATVVAVTFVISVLVIGGVLYLLHPTWVQKIDKGTGKAEISLELLASYSITFASVCCIATLLVISGTRKPVSAATHEPEGSFPSHQMALAFTDVGKHGHLVV